MKAHELKLAEDSEDTKFKVTYKDVAEAVEEEPGPQHRIAVKVTDPNTYNDVQKIVRVDATDKQDALDQVEAFYAKKGIYIVDIKYLGMVGQQGAAAGVAETVSMDQAKKVLGHYGAEHFKTTTNELHFYKNGQHMSVDLIFNDDATRSVSLSQLNSATRQLKGQGVAEGLDDPWGDQGNFAGDRLVNIGGDTVKQLGVGDIVLYLGQKAKILAQSKPDREFSRITIASGFGGTTKDVHTSDLKRLSKGMAEANPMDLSHGSGTELKLSPEYRRDVKDNKQITSQRKASNVRVQKGYSYYDDKNKVNEGSLDEIHDIVSRMMDKYISKYRSGLIDPDHFMSIISKAAQVLSNKYNIQQIEAQQLISDYVEDAAVKKDEIANQNYRADTMSEGEIREEQLLATDLKRQLELFKRGKDKELGKKPKDAEIQKKRQEK